MNKVLIRARNVDNNKLLPIIIRGNDDLSDFNEYSNVSKSSQILSGMDKGEESELHLQEVLRELQCEKTTVNTAIPIPEVHKEPAYNTIYRTTFICPINYIRLKTLEFEDESPEYDLDEEDLEWLENSKLKVTQLKFEKIVEEFERACCQKALLLEEAKALLRHEPIHIVIAVYDYWLTKRVRKGQPLFLSVKAEKAERCNNTPIDPYIAFRKRSERMTTRKNRRVDESSYEKMYRLRHHMEKLSETIETVSQRESTKRHITEIERDIFIKRYECRDYDKVHLKESEVEASATAAMVTTPRSGTQPLKLLSDNFKAAQRSREENHKETRRKRPSMTKTPITEFQGRPPSSSTETAENDDIDFTFRPMYGCKYLPFKTELVSAGYSCDRDDPHAIVPATLESQSLPPQSLSTVSSAMYLHTLCQRYVYCGLPLLNVPQPTPTFPTPTQTFSQPSLTTYHHQISPLPTQAPHANHRSPAAFSTNSDLSTPNNAPTKRPSPPPITKDSTYSNANHNPLIRSGSTAVPSSPSPSPLSKAPQRPGLNCLKSLTNKRLLNPRDNIDGLTAQFYSKSPSNGHHNHQHHHHSHHGLQRDLWNSGLRPPQHSLLVPHAMTGGLNKMS